MKINRSKSLRGTPVLEALQRQYPDIASELDKRTGRSKFGNTVTFVHGVRFDSAKEAKRYAELQLLQRAKLISDLERQVKYRCEVNGLHICDYICDHRYRDLQRGGELVVEDVKSEFTADLPMFQLKKKLVKALHGIDIVEFI